MKVDVTTELKDFLDQFTGNPLNPNSDLEAKINELFVDDDTELVYSGEIFSKKDVNSLIKIIREQNGK